MALEDIRIKWEKYAKHITGASQVTFGDDHLGGCNIYGDPACECPKMWQYLKVQYDVKSVVDVGCGFGFHTYYFKNILDCDVLGVEGSSKVVEISLLPNDIICHDYTTGPFVPKKCYDLCWCIEFVEHVDSSYIRNFMATFKKCRVLAMTHGLPGQAGYHHVNCQSPEYWIELLSDHGFRLNTSVTDRCRELAKIDCEDYIAWRSDTDPDKTFRGPAAQANDHRKNDELVPWFAHNGLVFENIDI